MATPWRRMLATTVLLLMVSPGCRIDTSSREANNQLPDNRTIDTFSYCFSTVGFDSPNAKLPLFGAPWASLTVTGEGKVHYSYASDSETNSGGQTIVEDWQIPGEEATGLLNGLVADGLLKVPSGVVGKGHSFTVSYGRWQFTCRPESMPHRIIARLRPYLDKGQADLKAKQLRAAALKPVLPNH